MRGEVIAPSSLLELTLQLLSDCADLTYEHFPLTQVHIVYFAHLVGNEPLRKDVLEPLSEQYEKDAIAILTHLSRSSYSLRFTSDELVKGILAGSVAIFYKQKAYLYDAYSPASRSIENTETESIINGPKDSFTESIGTNLSLIRRRLKDARLKSQSFSIGQYTQTTLTLLYIEGIAQSNHIDQLREKLQSLEVDAVYDTNMLVQYINPYPYSLFPQFHTSDRPDIMASKLTDGKIVGLLDGSPIAFSAPTSFVEFFSSPDDYYQPYAVASAVRLLRFIALLITLTFTAFYVSLVTYHYEMIPRSLLFNLMESRNKVPFSPLMEAIFMEMTIELLREAGARLPSKIGSTIGTVGGIIIGQAAVLAGITSNILIISVSISAIASFVIPSYIMSASIRLLRFAIIIMAGIFGNFGLMFGIGLIMVQLSGFNLYGSSYLSPLAPLELNRWLDMVVRAPLHMLVKIKKNSSKNKN